jgi:hypothetical protein
MVERERLIWASKGLVVLALLAVGCGESPVLQTQEYSTIDGVESLTGSSCFSAAKGGRATTGTGSAPGADTTLAPSFSAEYDGTGDAVHFSVRDGTGAELVERTYDAAFLDSGKRDEVAVAPGGIPLRFVNWGAKTCDNDPAQ